MDTGTCEYEKIICSIIFSIFDTLLFFISKLTPGQMVESTSVVLKILRNFTSMCFYAT